MTSRAQDKPPLPSQSATYVKFMVNSYEFASRNRREVDVVSSLGVSVAVSDVGHTTEIERDGEVTIHHRRKRTNTPIVVRRAQILVDYLWQLPRHLKKFEAECLSCHDLIALTVGWFSTLLMPKRSRPRLVYDSHEFELGRSRAKPRSALRTALLKFWEGFLIRRCAFVISVNDSIADLLQEVHRLEQRPLVVRSTPSTWTLDPESIREHRKDFCRLLSVPDDTFLAMYHGGVVPNRGIENFLTSLAGAPGTAAVILGNGQPDYRARLASLAKHLGVSDRVLFHPAVPIADLRHYVAATDVGMILIRAVSDNNYLSLPNKLFENIQALNPVIGSAYPELSRIINGYQIGLTVDPEDPAAITVALNRMRADTSLRAGQSANLQAAKHDLCWEREQHVLRKAYAELLKTGTPNHE